MDDGELHAIAVLLQDSYGADSFNAALERAKSIAHNGQFRTVSVWERVASEILAIERLNSGGPRRESPSHGAEDLAAAE
jgi:hypothetical protein